MGRRVFSEHDAQVAAALVRAGTPTAYIASELGWSASTISRQLLARGIRIPYPKRVYTPAKGRQLEDALACKSVKDALEEVGISYTTYDGWCKQGLVKRRPKSKDEYYAKIHARYMACGEQPAQLAKIYRVKYHTLLNAWRRLGLPVDSARARQQAAQTYRQGVYVPPHDELARIWRRYAAGELNAHTAARAAGIGWARLRQLWVDAGYPIDRIARRKLEQKSHKRGKKQSEEARP
jgi:hypothetical protein